MARRPPIRRFRRYTTRDREFLVSEWDRLCQTVEDLYSTDYGEGFDLSVNGGIAHVRCNKRFVMPRIIVLFDGSPLEIPDGAVLCDGTHDTTDLRDKFIVAGHHWDEESEAWVTDIEEIEIEEEEEYAYVAEGGAASHTHSPHSAHCHSVDALTVVVPGHAHGPGAMSVVLANHAHDMDHYHQVYQGSEMVDVAGSAGASNFGWGITDGPLNTTSGSAMVNTGGAGGSTDTSGGVSLAVDGDLSPEDVALEHDWQNHIPLYYCLAFIKFLGI